ncbi:hypothetical protein AYI69_g2354 [Smittium culicis]|uniref:Core-binding (CB) domain-containing protein n=1 Tax=Smittium culicis TaxID=133412 RepID=A0A1R1YMN8_9FUNG|nr:hypothetical protein AYI69_g2354 [Smittium culicis]
MDQEKLGVLISSKKSEKRLNISSTFAGANSKVQKTSPNDTKLSQAGARPRKMVPVEGASRFSEVADEQIFSFWATGIDFTLAAQQAEDQTRGPPDPVGGSYLTIIKKRYRGSTSFQDQEPQTRSDEIRESQDGDFKMSGEFSLEGTENVYSTSSGTINVEEALRTEENLPLQDEIMDIECDPDRTGDPESTILDQQTEIIEWAFLPTRETRTGDLHKCQRHSMGDRCGFPIILGIVKSLGGVDAYQRQRIINNIFCSPVPEFCRSLGISLLRQYQDISFCQEVLWNDCSRVTEHHREHIETQHRIKYPNSSHIRFINSEPCERTEKTDYSIRTVFIGPDIRVNNDPEDESILQLVPRQDINLTELIRLKLVNLVKYLLLPALESNRPSSPEGETGAAEDHSDHTAVENRNMVPGPFAIVNRSTTPATSNICRFGSKKRKFSTFQQQDLVANDVEYQRSSLNNQSLMDTAINIILSDQRSDKRRYRYYTTQKRFLEWYISKNNGSQMQVSHIVNYFAEIFSTRKLNVNTIKAYKSVFMSLVSEPDTVENSPCLKEFLSAINDKEIKPFFKPSINSSPVVNKLRDLRRTKDYEIPMLTS